MDGIRFLRAVNGGEWISVGKTVAVIGGGNTAVDCARTAKRTGSDVTLVYRRTRDEMPAADEEVEALLQEGIEIRFLAAPMRFLGKDGEVSEMECVRMELGEPDASGRRRPVPVEGSEFSLPVDTVITRPRTGGRDLFRGRPRHRYDREAGRSRWTPRRGRPTWQGVFAGGDVVTGPAYVIDAIAAGKKAARSMSRYLKGEPLSGDPPAKGPERLSEAEAAGLARRFGRAERTPMAEETPG